MVVILVIVFAVVTVAHVAVELRMAGYKLQVARPVSGRQALRACLSSTLSATSLLIL